LDHMEILGPDVISIAREKAGIIRPGVPVIVSPQLPEVKELFKEVCKDKKSPMLYADPQHIRVRHRSINGQRFDFTCGKTHFADLRIKLIGYRQTYNACTAVCAARQLGIKKAYIKEGLGRMRIPARIEYIDNDPPLIIDGAHNEDSFLELKEILETFFNEVPKTVLFSVMKEKDIIRIMGIVSGFARDVVVTVAHKDRGADPEMLRLLLERLNTPVTVEKDPAEAFAMAMKKARQSGGLTVVCGSMHLARIIEGVWKDKRSV